MLQPTVVTLYNSKFGNSSDPSTHYNSAVNKGGAVFIQGADTDHEVTASIQECGFYGNLTPGDPDTICSTPQCGGAGLWTKFANSNLTGCVFDRNSSQTWAGFFGGAIYAESATLDAMNCTLFGNTVHISYSGAIYLQSAPSTFTNCLFSGNATTGSTGSNPTLYVLSCTATLNNCTVSGDYVGDTEYTGGCIRAANASATVNVNNSIIWCATPGQVTRGTSATASITHSDIKDDCASCSGCTCSGNLSSHPDPVFVDADGADNTVGTSDDDLHLKSSSPSSPCLDAGDDAGVTSASDLDGGPRIMSTHVDMGAYERCTSTGDCEGDSGCVTAECELSGKCLGTSASSTCDDGNGICCGGLCITDGCCAAADCDANSVCCSSTCYSGNCCGDTDCDAPTGYCKPSSHTCVQCLADSGCSASACTVGSLTQACSTSNTCVQCTSDSNCACLSGTTHCKTSANTCVQCTSDGNCSSPTPACNTSTNTCVQCTSDSNCSGGTPHCKTSTHTCVACTANNQCTGGKICCSSTDTCMLSILCGGGGS